MDHKIQAGRFVILNGISALCWSIIMACGGYFLGDVFGSILKEIKKYQSGFLLGLALVGLLVWIYRTYRVKL